MILNIKFANEICKTSEEYTVKGCTVQNKFVQYKVNLYSKAKKAIPGEIREPEYRHARREREERPISDRLSKEGHRVDALALRADERRDKLRKAAGSCK